MPDEPTAADAWAESLPEPSPEEAAEIGAAIDKALENLSSEPAPSREGGTQFPVPLSEEMFSVVAHDAIFVRDGQTIEHLAEDADYHRREVARLKADHGTLAAQVAALTEFARHVAGLAYGAEWGYPENCPDCENPGTRGMLIGHLGTLAEKAMGIDALRATAAPGEPA